jgi:hypothetical protein
MLYKIFITLAIISKILDEGQMGPTPKILNSYFKSDFDSFAPIGPVVFEKNIKLTTYPLTL